MRSSFTSSTAAWTPGSTGACIRCNRVISPPSPRAPGSPIASSTTRHARPSCWSAEKLPRPQAGSTIRSTLPGTRTCPPPDGGTMSPGVNSGRMTGFPMPREPKSGERIASPRGRLQIQEVASARPTSSTAKHYCAGSNPASLAQWRMRVFPNRRAALAHRIAAKDKQPARMCCTVGQRLVNFRLVCHGPGPRPAPRLPDSIPAELDEPRAAARSANFRALCEPQ